MIINAVTITPSTPDGTYIVEIQRRVSITCSGANPDVIVAWIREFSVQV